MSLSALRKRLLVPEPLAPKPAPQIYPLRELKSIFGVRTVERNSVGAYFHACGEHQSGKTRLAEAVMNAWQANGMDIVYITPAHRTQQALQIIRRSRERGRGATIIHQPFHHFQDLVDLGTLSKNHGPVNAVVVDEFTGIEAWSNALKIPHLINRWQFTGLNVLTIENAPAPYQEFTRIADVTLRLLGMRGNDLNFETKMRDGETGTGIFSFTDTP